ncbi:YihY/virulence factor BrkB family protein [Microbacterium sp. CJ88]|uniref:YihY/virulence factor BrkB family protein n=1 Tax=Microbacterium sp. CJ88 TaxID=3445672 RepID=UPI003F6563EF
MTSPADRRRAHPAARETAAQAAREEESLRARWESTQDALRERFDEPIARATEITRATLGWFPVRVWRHFLQHNGFLLAAGVSYQALFAIFAAVYVAFASAGLWLGGSPESVRAMIEVVNTYIPGLIQDEGGLFTPEQVTEVATHNTGVLTITGAIALAAVIWTAIGWVTFTRRAVRDIFGLPLDRRSYLLLKARDLLAAAVFGVALVVGSGLSAVSTWTLDWLFSLFGLPDVSGFLNSGLRIASVVVSFALNAAALGAMFRFLTGTSLRWRTIWPGAMLAGGALTALQLGAGLLFGYTPTNALLGTFAIFVGLLLWFRLNGIVMLVGAAWIAVAAADRDIPLQRVTDAERRAVEHRALLMAAQVRLRTAREARAGAPWYRAWAADRDVRAARTELAEVEASAPAADDRVGGRG